MSRVEAPEYHGWSLDGVAYHVGHLPGRKSVVLYRFEGTVIHPAAYFRGEDEAQAFLAWLDRFGGAR
jgi:hypothetical protein